MHEVIASVSEAISFSWFVGVFEHDIFIKNADPFYYSGNIRILS